MGPFVKAQRRKESGSASIRMSYFHDRAVIVGPAPQKSNRRPLCLEVVVLANGV